MSWLSALSLVVLFGLVGCKPLLEVEPTPSPSGEVTSSDSGASPTPTPFVFGNLSTGSLPRCEILEGWVPDLISPIDLTLSELDSSVSPSLGEHVGVWEGRWDGDQPAVLVVRYIEPTSAQATFILNGHFQTAMTQLQVTSDGLLWFQSTTLVGGSPVSLSYQWELREGVLHGERRAGDSEPSTIDMHRCSSVFITGALAGPLH